MNSAGAALAVLALVCGACRNAPANKPPAPETGLREASLMEWKGQFCGVLQGSHRVVRSAEQWRQLWAEIGQTTPLAPDFKACFAVAVFLGQHNTGGHGVKWLEPAASGPAVKVRYRKITPRGLAIQVLTQPFAVKLFPQSAPEIVVEALPE